MLHRVLAFLGLLLISPAHAALIEYSFNATAWCSPCGDFGLGSGDTITGGFLFDDAASRTLRPKTSAFMFPTSGGFPCRVTVKPSMVTVLRQWYSNFLGRILIKTTC